MLIRSATFNDIDPIMRLIKNCISHMHAQGIMQWGDSYPTADIFRADINNQSLYISEDTNQCYGVICLNEEQSPEYQGLPWVVTDGKILVIHRLAVEPQSQKQGIGRQLMDFAENYAVEQGYTSIRLDAYTGNPQALRFYEQRGYHMVGRVFFPNRVLPFNCYEK